MIMIFAVHPPPGRRPLGDGIVVFVGKLKSAKCVSGSHRSRIRSSCGVSPSKEFDRATAPYWAAHASGNERLVEAAGCGNRSHRSSYSERSAARPAEFM